MEKKSVGTHDGSFHADEVTACALLLLFNLIEADKIQRTRDQKELENCEFVCDVGGVYDPSKKRFDHHQSEYRGILSSAGMILLFLKEQNILEPKLYDFFNHSLVQGIDAVDNGLEKPKRGHCSFSSVIANFVPAEYDAPKEKMEEAFLDALHFTLGHLKRLQKKYAYNRSCEQFVKEAMKHKEKFLFFDKAMPWMEAFFELGGVEHPALFVIMPSGKHWKLRGIPPTYEDRMSVRLPQPMEWAGLLDEELRKKSGISGAIFCHKGRFISIWETKDDAFLALNFILNKNR